jgi:hypothetical protein
MLLYSTNTVIRKEILRFVKACCLLEFHLVLLFSREMIINVCMLWLMLVINLLIKIAVKIKILDLNL